MNRSTTVFLVNKNVRAFTAIYEPGSKPEMFKTFDQTIKKDDLVVVTTKTRFNFTVVKVVEANVAVDIEDASADVKWSVEKLDLTEHEKILVQEAEAVEKVKQAEFNRKRRELMDNLVGAEDVAAIKALPIYANGGSTPAPAAMTPAGGL